MIGPPMGASLHVIVRRRVNIDFAAAKSAGWHRRRKHIEDFCNVISYTFPAGEAFFIDAMRAVEGRITDPVLQAQVKDFIYQEAMHAKEHERCNRELDRSCSYGPKIEKVANGLLKMCRHYPKSTQLAIGCALEHMTAVFSDHMLRTREIFIASTDPAFAALWLWHAAEETEHKAVCVDVYRYVAGRGLFSYLQRVIFMVLTTLVFLGVVVVASVWSRRAPRKRGDPALEAAKLKPKPGETPPDAQPTGFLHLGGLLKDLVPLKLYLDYYRPGFEPWDHDNTDLVEAWKERFKGFGDRSAAPAES